MELNQIIYTVFFGYFLSVVSIFHLPSLLLCYSTNVTYSFFCFFKEFLSATNPLKSGSEPVLFGKLCGRQEVRLKLKQDDSVSGPKVYLLFKLLINNSTLFLKH